MGPMPLTGELEALLRLAQLHLAAAGVVAVDLLERIDQVVGLGGREAQIIEITHALPSERFRRLIEPPGECIELVQLRRPILAVIAGRPLAVLGVAGSAVGAVERRILETPGNELTQFPRGPAP